MDRIIMKSKYLDTNLADKAYYIREPFKDMSIAEYDKKYGKDAYKEDVNKRMLNAEIELQNELKKQYMETDISAIFKEHTEKEIMDFLNLFMKSKINREVLYYHPENVCMLTDETRKYFIKLSKAVEKTKGKELAPKDFLKFYRVCYDIAPTVVYPKEASDYFVYSHEHKFNYVDDYYIINELNQVDNINDWENRNLAHYEMTTYVHRDSDYKIDAKMYKLTDGLSLYRSKKTGVWTVIFRGWITACLRAIKQYIGLREMGYNIAIDAKKVLEYYDYEIKYVKMKMKEDKKKEQERLKENI